MNKLSDLIKTTSSAFFAAPNKKTRWFNITWCILLVLLGAILWAKFLNFGNIPFNYHDWAEINAPRLAFVKDALTQGKLPLHMNDSHALRNITDRYMSIPDAIISPQIILLRFMSVRQFVLVNTLLLYFIGAWGLIKLKQRFKLSPFTFAVMFALFNFNGHILAHYSVGHITWAGSFLFSWFIYLVFDLLDGQKSWAWVTKMAFLIFFIFIQGSFHQFVWCLLFLGFMAVSYWKSFWPIVKVGVAAAVLSLIRILPPILLLNEFDDEFLGGYPTLLDMIKSMLVIVYPENALEVRSFLSNLSWWEYDFYIGLAGFLFIAIFGLGFWLRKLIKQKGFYPQLLLPMLALFLFSIGRIYRIIRFIPIPLFSGERASIRMLLLPMLFLMVIAAVMCQKWLNKRDISKEKITQALGYSTLLLIANDLWQHLKVWEVSKTYLAFPNTPVDLTIKVVANHPDPAYTNSLIAGTVLSIAGMLTLLILVLRERKNNI
ncbi:MAG: hypothetical protein JEZ00_10625 [Anaerolineaceae bacterium]|nr:hypothetical protein [Anaerolineaceae bacterium]